MRGFRRRSMRSKAASYAPVPQCEDPTRKAKDRVTSFESRIQKLETRRSRRRAHEGHEGEGHEDREDHASVARFTENGSGKTGRDPKFMHGRYRALIKQGDNSNPTDWDAPFRQQTWESVNFSVNGIARIIGTLK